MSTTFSTGSDQRLVQGTVARENQPTNLHRPLHPQLDLHHLHHHLEEAIAKTRMATDFVRIGSNGLALTAGTPHGLFLTAKSCVDNAAAVEPATAKTRMTGGFVKIVSNGLALTAGTPHGLFPTARSCVENA